MRIYVLSAVAILLLAPAAEAAPPAERSSPTVQWTFDRGMSLRQIAEDCYGNPAFHRMVALFNDLDPERIPEGTVIRTPPLPKMFEELGLIPRYEEALTAIFSCLDEYQGLLEEYRPLRRAAGGYSRRGVIELPMDLVERFQKLADSLDRSARIIDERSRQRGDVPGRLLAQLEKAGHALRELASGRVDGYGYDEDMVVQRLAHALANAVAWSRE